MKICFVLTTHFQQEKGGLEKQAELLSNYMALNGHEVHYICYNRDDNFEFDDRDNMNFYRIYEPFKKYKGLKFLMHLHKDEIYHILDKIKPDIIYMRGNFNFSNIISSYAKNKDIPFVSGISSDDLCEIPDFFNKKTFLIRIINHILSRKVLEDSTMIIAQTKHQQKLLKKNFGLTSVVITNGHVVPDPPFIKDDPPVVLWVANIKRWKQPEIFLKLAKRLIDTRCEFVYCGRPSGDLNYQQKLERFTNKLSNVTYLGEVPFHEVNNLLSKASIFINTSLPQEGFPNTFIQAWMRETPVVTLHFDPDDIIKRNKMGYKSGDLDKMIEQVKYLLKNKDVRKRMGNNSRKYAVKHHDFKKTGKRHEKVFKKILE